MKSRKLRSTPTSRRPRLALLPLEDRTVPSSPVPDGLEFRVNTTTAGVQATTIFPHNYVVVDNLNAVASDGQGNTVAVWGGNGPGDADGVFAQRYDAAGNALGTETRLNTTTAGVQTSPVVARASAAGSYAAAWDNGTSVSARVFSVSGAAVTGELTVAAASSSTKNYVAGIAMDASGDFAVVYKQAVHKGFSDTNYWYTQRYNAAGQAQDKAIKIATPTLANGRASVGMDSAGNFVAAWDDNASSIYAQRYDSGGRAVGSRITANAGLTAGTNWESNVAMGAAGDFVVTWFNQQYPVNQQYAQAFNATGSPRGSAFTFGSPTEIPTSIAVEGNGDFILAWATDWASPYSGDADILAQRYTADGVAKEAVVPVNTTTAGDQVVPSVAVDSAGGFVVVWNTPVLQANAPSTAILLDCEVYGQRFVFSSPPMMAMMWAAPAEAPDVGTSEAPVRSIAYAAADGTAPAVDRPAPASIPVPLAPPARAAAALDPGALDLSGAFVG